MAEIQNSVYKNPEVSQKLKKMFNKPKYSDSVFLVNQTKFHASSHLVSVSCRELETMLDDHFENCGDREVKIGPIKHEDSFSVILKDIYGLEINFTELSKDVLCEVLCLSEQYELTNLFNQLKLFISNLDQFEIESVVSLLNTARKYKLTDLYEKVKMYCFENSEQLVKHVSFSNLKYDMLLELISSDWFAADEINILTSALTWHSSNINNPDSPDTEDIFILGEESIYQIDQTKNDVAMALQLEAGSSEEGTNGNSLNIELSNPTHVNNNEDVLKTFSDKILISMLSQIRFSLISCLSMQEFASKELFSKYKEFLSIIKYTSPVCEPRNNYIGQKPVCKTGILNFTSKFKVDWNDHTMYESIEELQVEGMKWKVCAMHTDKNENGKGLENDMRRVDVYLKCTSLDICKWKCEIKLISRNPEQVPTQYLTACKTFTPENKQLQVGSFYFPLAWRDIYLENNKFNFEVRFKSIRKLNKWKKYIDQEQEYKMELVTNILTVKASGKWNEFFESNEECHSGGMPWKICVIYTGNHMNGVELANEMRRLDVYLKCTSLDNGNRQCEVQCEIRLISRNPDKAPTQYLTVYKTITPENIQLQVGKFYFPYVWKDTYYVENGNYTFEVCFKSIRNLNA